MTWLEDNLLRETDKKDKSKKFKSQRPATIIFINWYNQMTGENLNPYDYVLHHKDNNHYNNNINNLILMGDQQHNKHHDHFISDDKLKDIKELDVGYIVSNYIKYLENLAKEENN